MLQKSDPRNTNLLIYVKDKIVPRAEAKVSVFDSVVQGGDAVWEGLRLYKKGVFCLDRHMQRLVESAHALAFEGVPKVESIKEALFATLKANNMEDEVHIRLTLTRGEKITSGMDPRLNQFGCCLIIVPEYKPPVYDNENGISVITSTIRRNSPLFLDSKIHHNNLLNNIQAKIQANVAGVDAALMLDKDGFAAELSGTNIFIVKDGIVRTPYAHACLPGITRGIVIEICKTNNIPWQESNLSLTELYNADEFFCTGTMGELTPIHTLDGRKVPLNEPSEKVLPRLISYFEGLRERYCESV